ncbi:MAG: superoxide dismutase [Candidatus Woesearchaeota archaeon]|nr:MAG: superoxide dismutase [Candidatus Woesearchaeota archaeon]
MTYEPKNYDHLLGTPGFSDQLLKNHFTLYQGYVTNTNKIIDLMMSMVKEGKAGTPEFAEIKRRFGWEFNGMRLHEYYFSNMSKTKKTFNKNSKLAKALMQQFNTYENWESAFKAVGAMRGIGWVILVYDPQGKKFFNLWVNEHDLGHCAGTIPLLILDVFEHAYMIDYGLKKADYINAFFNSIDWDEVNKRFEAIK